MKDALKARSWVKKFTAILLFAAIILVFVFWGVHSEMSGMSGPGAAARVNNSIISVADLRNEVERMEQIYEQMLGGARSTPEQRQMITQSALESLIFSELVFQAAGQEGIRTSDEEVADIIVRQIPAFQQNGVFSRDLYLGYLSAVRSSAGSFEERLRRERSGERLRRLIEISSAPLSLETERAQALAAEEVQIEYVRFSRSEMMRNQTLSPSEIAEALENPSFVERLRRDYDSQPQRFARDEQVQASHILISLGEGARSVEEALVLAEETAQRLAAGEDFAALAQELSEDPGSRERGGDLGFFERGRMVPEFEQAAFRLQPGQTSEPVLSDFGYHIIRVTDRREARSQDFEEVREELAREILQREGVDLALQELDQILMNRDDAALQAWLDRRALSWGESDYFTMAEERVPVLPQFSEAMATVAALHPEQPLAPGILREGDSRALVRLKDRRQAEQATLNPQEFAERLRGERSQDLFRTWVDRLREEAKITRNQALMGAF